MQAEVTEALGDDSAARSPGWRWVLPPTQTPCWRPYSLGFAAMTRWDQTLSPLREDSVSAGIHRSFSPLGTVFAAKTTRRMCFLSSLSLHGNVS